MTYTTRRHQPVPPSPWTTKAEPYGRSLTADVDPASRHNGKLRVDAIDDDNDPTAVALVYVRGAGGEMTTAGLRRAADAFRILAVWLDGAGR